MPAEAIKDHPLFQEWTTQLGVRKVVSPNTWDRLVNSTLFEGKLSVSDQMLLVAPLSDVFSGMDSDRLRKTFGSSVKAELSKTDSDLSFYHRSSLEGLIVHKMYSRQIQYWRWISEGIRSAADVLHGVESKPIVIPSAPFILVDGRPKVRARSDRPWDIYSRYCGLRVASFGIVLDDATGEFVLTKQPQSDTEWVFIDAIMQRIQTIKSQFQQLNIEHGHLHGGNITVEMIRKGYLKEKFREGYSINTLPFDRDAFSFIPEDWYANGSLATVDSVESNKDITENDDDAFVLVVRAIDDDALHLRLENVSPPPAERLFVLLKGDVYEQEVAYEFIKQYGGPWPEDYWDVFLWILKKSSKNTYHTELINTAARQFHLPKKVLLQLPELLKDKRVRESIAWLLHKHDPTTPPVWSEATWPVLIDWYNKPKDSGELFRLNGVFATQKQWPEMLWNAVNIWLNGPKNDQARTIHYALIDRYIEDSLPADVKESYQKYLANNRFAHEEVNHKREKLEEYNAWLARYHKSHS